MTTIRPPPPGTGRPSSSCPRSWSGARPQSSWFHQRTHYGRGPHPRSAKGGRGAPWSASIRSTCSLHFAAQAVLAGAYDIVVARGVESISHVAMRLNMAGADLDGPRLAARYPDGLVPQGVSAELIAPAGPRPGCAGRVRAGVPAAGGGSPGRGATRPEIVPLKVTGATGEQFEVVADEGIWEMALISRLRPSLGVVPWACSGQSCIVHSRPKVA
jgi:hypothetical protein